MTWDDEIRAWGPTPVQMDPNLAAALAAIEPLWPRLLAALVPAPGSSAAADGKQRVGKHALELATVGLSFGIEHLESWRVLGLEARKLLPHAHLALIRSSLEGIVRARWLLEPGITRDERRLRGLQAQRADYVERDKFEREAGSRHSGGGKSARGRIDDLERTAKSLGLGDLKDPPNRTVLFEHYIFPPTQQVGGSRKTGRLIYRILSAPTHGNQWALLMGPRPRVIAGPEPGSLLGKFEINQGLATMATEVAVFAFEAALRELEAYTRT